MFKLDNRRGKNSVRKANKCFQRQLAAEELEDRRLLAGDLALYQNQLMHSDVNADGTVNVGDLTALVGSLRSGGPRSLVSGGAEGEPGSVTTAPLYIDVNGDNLLSVADVTSVVRTLRGEAAPGDVMFSVRLLVGGVPSATVGENQPFTLEVYVEDNRDPASDPALMNNPDNLGLASLDFDVSFTEALVTAGTLSFSPTAGSRYSDLSHTVIDAGGVGLDDNVFAFRDTLFTDTIPLKGDPVLVFSQDFTAAAAAGNTIFFQTGFSLTGGDVNGGWGNFYDISSSSTMVPIGDIVFLGGQIDIVAFSNNDPVGGVDFAYTTQEDVSLTISAPGLTDGTGNPVTFDPAFGVLNNDSDADAGTTLTAALVPGSATPGGGTITLQPNGTFTYVPAANFNGDFTFMYRASDGARLSAPTTVTIHVTSQPDAPVLTPDIYKTPLNTPLVTTDASGTGTPAISNDNGVLANDSDGDSADAPPNTQSLQVIEVNSDNTAIGNNRPTSAGGTVNMNADGTFTYTPPTPTFIGVDTFAYTAASFTGGGQTAETPVSTTVEIRVGLDPRNVSGFVYSDKNNNGLRETGELGLGGVQIELTGMDFQSNPVNLVTHTNVSGHYQFVDVLPGTYTVREIQPTVLIDGKDTIGTDTNGVLTNLDAPVTNDQFQFALTGVSDAVDINFGELGRKAEFFSLSEFLASSSGTSSLAAFGPGGVFQFVQLDPVQWPTIVSLTITLNGNGTATINAVDTGMNALQTTVATTGDARFQIIVQSTNGIVVRLAGQSAFFP